MIYEDVGGQQHLHCIKAKTHLSFTSLMVALIRVEGGGVPTESGSKGDQAFVTRALNCGPALCSEFQTSASLLHHPGVRRCSPCSGASSFWFWILWVVFFCFVSFISLFLYLWFSCLCAPSLASSTSGCHICFIEDAFGALLLLSIARQAVNFCRGLHAETPRHT